MHETAPIANTHIHTCVQHKSDDKQPKKDAMVRSPPAVDFQVDQFQVRFSFSFVVSHTISCALDFFSGLKGTTLYLCSYE